MFVSLRGDKHRFRDLPWWFCFCLDGVDPHVAMNVKWVRRKEETVVDHNIILMAI